MKKFLINQKTTNRTSIAIENYLKDIAKYSLLTPEREQELIKRSLDGDINARNELVRHNLRFVVSVAKSYATHHENFGDLINEGNIGLIHAAERFSLEKKFKFITYAVWWIRKKILEYISENGRLIHLPSDKVGDLMILDKQINSLEQKLGRSVTIDEVIDEFGHEFSISKNKNKYKKYEKLVKDYHLLASLTSLTVESLDKKLDDEDSNSGTLSEMISDDYFKSGDKLIEDKEAKNKIYSLLSKLKDRDKDIMIKYYGLDGGISRTMDDLGEEYDISREMVRQIKDKSLKKLKHILQTNKIDI